MSSPTPLLARANFRFKGMNNDELNFKKGDVITVTQPLDGGWWEGTLDGKTGWFPSNYVTPVPTPTPSSHRAPSAMTSSSSSSSSKPLAAVEECQMNGHGELENGDGGGGGVDEDECAASASTGGGGANILDSSSSSSTSSTTAAAVPAHHLKDFPTRKRESMILYHNVVLDNIIDSEGAFVNDMRALISAVLIPLRLRCGASVAAGAARKDREEWEEGEEVEEEVKPAEVKEDVVCSSLPSSLTAGVLSEKALSSSLPVASPLSDSQTARLLSSEEVAKLGGNIDDILQFHQELLHKLEEIKRLPIHEQRVGGLFLSGASKAKSFYEIYFANHPSAIDVLMQRKEELKRFLEGEAGISPPGDLYLTQSLSSVFRRLEKYPTLFKELERYLDEFHADRGDTQRAFSVYQDILLSCHHIRHMRALELEVLVHPFRPSPPPPLASSFIPSSSSAPTTAKIHGWRGEGRLGGEMGPVTLLSEVFVLDLKRLKEEDALLNENNNDIHTLSSSQYSENSSGGITITSSTVGEDGSLASSPSIPLSDVSMTTTTGTLAGDTTIDSLLSSSDASSSTPTSRSNAIPIPGASAKELNCPSPALMNGVAESSPGLNTGNCSETGELNASQPPAPTPPCASAASTASSSASATKQFLILYPTSLLILSVSPCMKRFVLDCRFDGDTKPLLARAIPPLIASNMLAEADGAMFDAADSSTVSSFPPQNALELSNLPGPTGGLPGTKLNAIFTSKIDRDVWLERHLPPPSPMQDSGLSAPSQGTSVSSPSSGVTPSSSPVPPPPPSSPPPPITAGSLPSQGSSPQQGCMTVSQLAAQGEVESLLNFPDTQPAAVSSPPSASPPPTLVPITSIPPPQPLKPQESTGKPPAPPPPAISPHPPPLPPPPSSYSIMLSAAAAANNAQDIGRPGLSTPSTHSHSPSSQPTTQDSSSSLVSHSQLTALNKSATLPAESAPSMMNKAATLPARLTNRPHPGSPTAKNNQSNNHHLSRPPVIPIHHPQWTLSCLRPNPPVRPNASQPQTSQTTTTMTTSMRNGDVAGKSNTASTKASSKKFIEDSLLDEAEILRVIEAYCTTVKARNTVNSTFIDSPQVLIPAEEKLIVEERKGNQLVVEEKTLVDTVYALKDQVADILDQMKDLKSSLDHERKARKRMEMTIRKTLMKSGGHDLSSSSTSVSLSSAAQPPALPPPLPPPLPSQPPPLAPPPSISITNEAIDSNVFV